MEKPSYRAYRFKGFELDLKRRRLLGGKQELSSKAFQVLKYLCEHPRTLVTKEKLIKEVWGTRGAHVEEDSAKNCISEIRKALGEKGNIIETTRKDEFADGDYIYGGYSLECEVERIEADPGDEERTVGEAMSGEVSPLQEPARSDDSSDEPRMEPSQPTAPEPAVEETENESVSAALASVATGAATDDLSNKAPDEFDNLPDDGYERFERWLTSGPGRRIFWCLLIGVVLTWFLSAIVAGSGGESSNDRARQVISAAQCLVILILWFHSRTLFKEGGLLSGDECGKAPILKAGFKDEAEYESERPGFESDLKKFTFRWRLLLLSWVPLYAVFTLMEGRGGKVFIVILNLLNTSAMGACFNSLNKHVDEHDREHVPGSFWNVVMLVVLGGMLSAYILRMSIAYALGLLSKRPDDAILLAEADGATLVTGIMAGITMALFIGRIQSRFIGPHFLILYLLYSYTALQPLVLYIQDHPEWGWKILGFALILKCLLYVYIVWLLQSGLLLFYFASVKRTDDIAMRQQRRAFRRLLRKRP